MAVVGVGGSFLFLPFGAWRVWMQPYPAGIPQAGGFFNGNNIRFKGAFFQMLFAQKNW